MSDPGVIALDPVRLAGLEQYLAGLADGFGRRADTVEAEVASCGLAPPAVVGEMREVAATFRREHDEVAWSRARVAAIEGGLPLTDFAFSSRADARAQADDLAADLIAAVDADPPRWERLVALLAQVDRGIASPTFAAHLLAAIGGRRARALPFVLEAAWPRRVGADDDLGGDGDLPGPDAEVAEAQARLADLVRVGSTARGDDALPEAWLRTFAGLPSSNDDVAGLTEDLDVEGRRIVDEVEQAMRRAGHGLHMASTVALAVGAGRAAVVLTADRGVLGIATAALALADGDGPACDVPEAAAGIAAGVLTVVGSVAGGPAVGFVLGSIVFSGVAALFNACRRQPARPNETTLRTDVANGQPRLPSGHQTNPHVDVAGVPLPPSYG